jgi:cobalt-zinc-cadmium efflux system outer membrane protein
MKYELPNLIAADPVAVRFTTHCTRPFPAVLLRAMLPILLAVLTGCAGLPQENGRGTVDQLLLDRGTPVDAANAQLLATLTGDTLTPQSVIRIALINNPDLQSTYASLGFGAANVYAAGRIRNPVLGVSVLSPSRSEERDQVTFGLVASFTDLITLPARSRLAAGEFAALQQAVGAEVLAVAAQTEMAYYDYVRAQQVAALRTQIATAGALSSALATRFGEAGNMPPRELALEHAAASQARLAAMEADAATYSARTALATLLGLSVADGWVVPAQLPLPVAQEDALDSLLLLAEQSRLDLAAARTRAEVRVDQVGVVNWTRWLGELDVGFERERESGGGSLSGPSLGWEIPIFNQHEDALLRADTELQLAIQDVRRATLDVQNSVRLAYANLNTARARVVEYQDVLIPQRIATVVAAQQEFSFMLIGAFELIALKQDEYDTYQGYFEAIGDYWVARAELGLAIGTALPSNARIGDTSIDAEQFIKPAAGAMDHSAHGAMSGGATPTEAGGEKSAPMDHSAHGMMESDQAKTTDSNAGGEHSGMQGMTHPPGHNMTQEMDNGGTQ